MIVIRNMEEKDVDSVCRLEEEAFSMPWHKESFLDMIKNPDAFYLVAVEDDKVYACCGVLSIVGEGDITNVVVDATKRGQGIGKKLVGEMLKRAQSEYGIETFTLEVRVSNAPAIKLYESLGFVSEGIRKNFYEKPKEDAMIMWRR